MVSPRNPAPVSAGVPGLEPRTNDSDLGYATPPQLGRNPADFRGFHGFYCTRWHGLIRAHSGHAAGYLVRFWSRLNAAHASASQANSAQPRLDINSGISGFLTVHGQTFAARGCRVFSSAVGVQAESTRVTRPAPTKPVRKIRRSTAVTYRRISTLSGSRSAIAR